MVIIVEGVRDLEDQLMKLRAEDGVQRELDEELRLSRRGREVEEAKNDGGKPSS